MLLQRTWCDQTGDETGLDSDIPLPKEIENDFQSWLEKLKMSYKAQMTGYVFMSYQSFQI